MWEGETTLTNAPPCGFTCRPAGSMASSCPEDAAERRASRSASTSASTLVSLCSSRRAAPGWPALSAYTTTPTRMRSFTSQPSPAGAAHSHVRQSAPQAGTNATT